MLRNILKLSIVIAVTAAAIYSFDAVAGIERTTIINEGTNASGRPQVTATQYDW